MNDSPPGRHDEGPGQQVTTDSVTIDAQPKRPSVARILVMLLQAAISIALLTWVISDILGQQNLGRLFSAPSIPWLLAGLGCVGIMVLFSIFRWRIFLKMQNVQLPFLRTFRLVLIGMFFDLFFPSSTGGDTIRSILIIREHPNRKASAIMSIFMDHLSGFIALLSAAAIFTTAKADKLLANPITAGLYTLLWGFMGFSVFGIIMCLIVSRVAQPQKLNIPATFKKYLLEVHDSFAMFTKRPLSSLAAAALSFVILFSHFTAFFCSARAMGVEIKLVELYSAAPIIEVVTMLPVSFSGLGVREKSYEYLLDVIAGVPSHLGALTSLGGFAFMVAWSLVGGVLFAIYRSSRN